MSARGWKQAVWGILLLVLLVVVACNVPAAPAGAGPAESVAAPTPEAASGGVPAATEAQGASESPTAPSVAPTPTVEHRTHPGDPTSRGYWVGDPICGLSAQQGVPNQPPGGDQYHWNLYERPFNAQKQDVYFPELDITYAEVATDRHGWLYVTIKLYDDPLDAKKPLPSYGWEIDTDIDGRGEVLVWAQGPFSQDWSTDGVVVYRDPNNDVGEARACRDDPPQDGNSYDAVAFDSGQGDDPDTAWVRLRTVDGVPVVQLALKYAFIDNAPKFMWWAWADRGVNMPQWMDYHDHFTLEEAGEPYKGRATYPIKAIAEVDNTCHWVFGFSPTGEEPCLCAGSVTQTPTPESPPASATVTGHLFKDRNGNHVYDAGEGLSGFSVIAHENTCGGAVATTAVTGDDGFYSMVLPEGAYCLKPGTAVTWIPAQRTVTITNGSTIGGQDFRYPAP